MIGFFTILGIIALATLPFICIMNNSGPLGLITSVCSWKEFKILTQVILEDPDMHYDQFNVRTKDYEVWYCNGSFGFKINDISRFSLFQKLYFLHKFKQLRKTKKGNVYQKQREKLKLHTLTPAGQVLYGKKNK